MSVKFTEAFKIQAVQKALNRTANSNIKDVADLLGIGLSALLIAKTIYVQTVP